MSIPQGEVSTVVGLLKQATSLRVIGEFLKSKEMPQTVTSWESLETDRIQPAVDEGLITIDDLYELLAEVEEYGHSHIFLYRIKPEIARSLVDPIRIKEEARKAGLSRLIDKPLRTLLPEAPTITGIRIGEGTGGSLSIKVVETRDEEKLVRTKKRGPRTFFVYETVKVRAVNVLRLSSSGILEVRIQSHGNSSTYVDDIDRIWKGAVFSLLPKEDFRRISLSGLKEKLWKSAGEMADRLRFSDTRMKTATGFTGTFATPKAASDLKSDEGSVNAITEYLSAGARQESLNIWWKARPDNIPSREVHVLLSGLLNEFTLTASCSKADYEYVLAQFTAIGF